MIVQPDFLDHWKSKRLMRLLGRPDAPLFVVRLWAHCQNMRSDRISKADAAVLAEVCGYYEGNEKFHQALLDCRFIELDGEDIVVHGWAEVNGTLLGRWKGGEATKAKWSAKPKPSHTDSIAKAKPKLSQGEKRRGEKSREDKSTDVGKLNFPNGLTDSEWLSRLAQDKTYEGIDVMREHGKLINWCKTNQKSATRRRFINWLNRCDKPLSETPEKTSRRSNYLDAPARDYTPEELAANRKAIQKTKALVAGLADKMKP